MKHRPIASVTFLQPVMLAGRAESSVKIDDNGRGRGIFTCRIDQKCDRVHLGKSDGRSVSVPMAVCCFNYAPPEPAPTPEPEE